MWKTILDLFFPINCLGCGQPGQFICPACFEQMPLNKESPSDRRRHNGTGQESELTRLTGLIIASDYNHALVRQAIHRYKYDFIKDLAEPLGELMVKRLSVVLRTKPEESKNNIILIPVPLHPKRLRWRGFNQAELLAQKISQELKIPLANHILIRQKYRLPQMAIKSSQQRKENIKQAFKLNKRFDLESSDSRFDFESSDLAAGKVTLERSNLELKYPLKNKTIILVDDVSTTGATLEECAKVLKLLRPKEVWGLVIAHG